MLQGLGQMLMLSEKAILAVDGLATATGQEVRKVLRRREASKSKTWREGTKVIMQLRKKRKLVGSKMQKRRNKY